MSISGAARDPLPSDVLRRMTESIAYRGPDDAGYVSGGGCSLGARRLSIIDVEGGHQPLSDETGRVWAAQNGEIYNHDALRAELRDRGHVLRSRCDTEVLPHLYEEAGPAACERLRGMFALAIWDREARRGVLVRDRIGIKPLYYAVVGDTVVFGSELKAVIASGLVSGELDHEAIAAFLTLGYVPGSMTPLKDVRKLRAGERLVVENDSWRLEEWWRYPAPDPEPRPAEEWAERVLEALDDAVRMRLMSDVPLGAMLSGGLDSSLIVALMGRHTDQPVKTFSVGFEGVDSELTDARAVAAVLGAEHHELEVPLSSDLGYLERVAWHLDEPLMDISSLGFLALCELAVDHVTVALAGQGADELFGGYGKHRAASLSESWTRLPGGVQGAAALALRQGSARSRRLADSLESPDPATRLLRTTNMVQPDLRDSLFSGALGEHADAAEAIIARDLSEIPTAAPLEASLYLDARLGLADDLLTYFDRTSMACSLEVRVPFLDHEFVELCARIPPKDKVRRFRGKRVLRMAAKGLVPDFVIEKRKRGFFAEELGPWLDADGGAIMDEVLLAPDRAYEQVVDRAVVTRAVAEFRQGRRGHGQLLLSLIMLELWIGRYLPRAFAAGEPERAPVY